MVSTAFSSLPLLATACHQSIVLSNATFHWVVLFVLMLLLPRVQGAEPMPGAAPWFDERIILTRLVSRGPGAVKVHMVQTIYSVAGANFTNVVVTGVVYAENRFSDKIFGV